MNHINQLSGQLSDYIIDNYEEKLLKKIIASEHGYLLPYEQEEIYRLSLKNKPECRDLISDRVKEYLVEHDTVIVDGFVAFRLKDYKTILEQTIERAVREFVVNKEYETFITLLRYFVEMQEPLYRHVHLMGNEDGTVSVQSNEGHNIQEDCDGDLLLDTLLTVAPERILFHRAGMLRNEELLHTLMSVFTGKITICNGCSLCGKIQ